MTKPIVTCAAELSFRALRHVPAVQAGADLGSLASAALHAEGLSLEPCDVLVVSSKIVSKAEGRMASLSTVTPSAQALELAARTGKDPRLVELILRDSDHVSRATRDVLIVRHKSGHVSANAGIDQSNLSVPGGEPGEPWVLRLPEDADASARRLREQLMAAWGVAIGVIISDSFGRPFRLGTVGMAIGAAGLPPISDQRGEPDLFGRKLEHTLTATADQLAAAADLVAGQAAEGRPLVLVRGLSFAASELGAGVLCRTPAGDLYL